MKYKSAESKSLDKAIAEMSSDRESASTELAAVLEYFEKLKERCFAKPETFEERVRRREAEIAGLKEALRILEEETLSRWRGPVAVRRVRPVRGARRGSVAFCVGKFLVGVRPRSF